MKKDRIIEEGSVLEKTARYRERTKSNALRNILVGASLLAATTIGGAKLLKIDPDMNFSGAIGETFSSMAQDLGNVVGGYNSDDSKTSQKSYTETPSQRTLDSKTYSK